MRGFAQRTGLSCDVTYNGFIRHNPIVSRGATVLVWRDLCCSSEWRDYTFWHTFPFTSALEDVFCSTHICPLHPRHTCSPFTRLGSPVCLKRTPCPQPVSGAYPLEAAFNCLWHLPSLPLRSTPSRPLSLEIHHSTPWSHFSLQPITCTAPARGRCFHTPWTSQRQDRRVGRQ